MNAIPIRQAFERDGFAIVRRVFSQDEIDYLKKRISEWLHYHAGKLRAGDIYYEEDGRIKNVSRFQQYDPYFKVLMELPRLVTIASKAFGYPAKGVDTTYFPKYAHSGSATPPHQDNAFDCLEPPESLVLTIAIDESDTDNGCLGCGPGTHLMGLLAHCPSGIAGFSQKLATEYPGKVVAIEMEPGDISIHHTNTVHGSEANNDDRNRRQFAIVFRTDRAKRDEVRWAKYQADLAALHAEKGLA